MSVDSLVAGRKFTDGYDEEILLSPCRCGSVLMWFYSGLSEAVIICQSCGASAFDFAVLDIEVVKQWNEAQKEKTT